jgi:hypothetical protein
MRTRWRASLALASPASIRRSATSPDILDIMTRVSAGLLVLLIVSIAGEARGQAAPPCIGADTYVRSVEVVGETVAVCAGDDAARTCWSRELAAKAWTVQPVTPPPARSTTEALATGLRVCSRDGSRCVELTPPGYDPNAAPSGVASDDLSIVALWGATGPMTFYEVATMKVLGRVKPWPTSVPKEPASFQSVAFLDGVAVVYVSETPVSASARLYEIRTGKKRGTVGKVATGLDEVAPAALGSNRWAFVTFMSTALLIVNVKTGKLEKTIKLAADELSGSGAAGLLTTSSGKLLLVPYEAAKPVYVIDPKKGVEATFALPICTP